MRRLSQNFGPSGLAVLTFIGHKQTNRQTERQAMHRMRNLGQFQLNGLQKEKIMGI